MKQWSLVLVAIIATITFLWRLGSIGLVDETEPLFAEASRQMLGTGNWVTPYFNGETRFDKPPLVYWLMAVGYQVLGVNEWAVRLPSALSAMGLTLFLFLVMERFGVSAMTSSQSVQRRWSSLIAGVTLALAPEFMIWARVGVSDLLLTGCMGGALLCFFVGYVESEKVEEKPFFSLSFPSGWYLSFYVLIALAVLAKGPVGLVLPGLIIIAFLLYQGKLWSVVKEMRVISGTILFLVITIPWHILIIIENGEDYIASFFGYHNVERFTSVVNEHGAPWYFYFLVVLIGFAPLSVYLPSAIAQLQVWRRRFWHNQPRHQQLGLFAFFWFTVIFVFFTIAVTKLPSYIIPLLPAAAILLGLFWGHYQTETISKGLIINGIINVIFALVLAGAFYYSPNWIGYDPAAPNLGEVYAKSRLNIVAAIIWSVAAVLMVIALIRQPYRRWLWGINLLAMLLTFIFVLEPAVSLMDEVRQQPLRELAQLEITEEEVIMIGMKKPSVVFYRQQNVEFFSDVESAIAHLEAQPDHESQLILSHPRHLKKIEQQAEITRLETKGEYQLARVHKN
ncbi:MAG: ArnT family glycosyltransferase [Halothece sp.]